MGKVPVAGSTSGNSAMPRMLTLLIVLFVSVGEANALMCTGAKLIRLMKLFCTVGLAEPMKSNAA